MIYDKFVNDATLRGLHDLLHVPGQTYNEYCYVQEAIKNREEEIRKLERQKFLILCKEFSERHRT